MRDQMQNSSKLHDSVAVRALTEKSSALPSRIFSDAALFDVQKRRRISRVGPTAKQAHRARRRLMKKLSKLDRRKYKSLIAELEQCRACEGDDRKPCWHGVCPVCERALGRRLAWTIPVATRKVLRVRGGLNDPTAWYRFTLITITLPLRLTQLDATSAPQELEQLVARVHAALDNAGVSLAIGVINIRGVRDISTKFDLHYSVSVRAIAMTAEVLTWQYKKAMAGYIGRDPTRRRSRPVQAETFYRNGPIPLTRLISRMFEQRYNTPGRLKSNGKSGRQKTRKSMIPAPEMGPLLSLYSALGLTGRLFLHGAKITTNKRERSVIRPTRQALRARDKDALIDDYFSDLDEL